MSWSFLEIWSVYQFYASNRHLNSLSLVPSLSDSNHFIFEPIFHSDNSSLWFSVAFSGSFSTLRIHLFSMTTINTQANHTVSTKLHSPAAWLNILWWTLSCTTYVRKTWVQAILQGTTITHFLRDLIPFLYCKQYITEGVLPYLC